MPKSGSSRPRDSRLESGGATGFAGHRQAPLVATGTTGPLSTRGMCDGVRAACSETIERPSKILYRKNGGVISSGAGFFLLVGGAATAATCLLLGAITFGRAILRSRKVLRAMQGGAFAVALAILLVGIFHHVPRRNPLLVIAAALALAVSASARRLERRHRVAS